MFYESGTSSLSQAAGFCLLLHNTCRNNNQKEKKRLGGSEDVTKNPVWIENFIQTQHGTSSGEAGRIMLLTHNGEESGWDAGRTEQAGGGWSGTV